MSAAQAHPEPSLAPSGLTLDQLYSIAYEELRRLARAVLRSDHAATLTPTTLVNEAWIKLSRAPELAGLDPLHFRRIAGRAMRQVLVDSARRRHAAMHGGQLRRVSFDDSQAVFAPEQDLQALLMLDRALRALEHFDSPLAMLVECRFFGGYSWAEIAESLGCSERTVMRDWRIARAWLASHMQPTVPLQRQA